MYWLIFLWLYFYFFLVLFFRLLIYRKSSIFFIVDANNVSIRKFAEKKKLKKICRRAIWKKQSTRSFSWKTVWNHFRCLQAQCEQSAKFGKLERQPKKKYVKARITKTFATQGTFPAYLLHHTLWSNQKYIRNFPRN